MSGCLFSSRRVVNQDLMNIMFDQSFRVSKQDLPVSLAYENVIFVFEDVDAASKIVKARGNNNSYNNNNNRRQNAARAPGQSTTTTTTTTSGKPKAITAPNQKNERVSQECSCGEKIVGLLYHGPYPLISFRFVLFLVFVRRVDENQACCGACVFLGRGGGGA